MILALLIIGEMFLKGTAAKHAKTYTCRFTEPFLCFSSGEFLRFAVLQKEQKGSNQM